MKIFLLFVILALFMLIMSLIFGDDPPVGLYLFEFGVAILTFIIVIAKFFMAEGVI